MAYITLEPLWRLIQGQFASLMNLVYSQNVWHMDLQNEFLVSIIFANNLLPSNDDFTTATGMQSENT